MESTHAIAQLDAMRLSDWIDATGLSRSTAYELLRLLQIEPEARRVPSSRKPVSHLTADQLEQLQPWAQQLASGATLPQIRDRLGRNAPSRTLGAQLVGRWADRLASPRCLMCKPSACPSWLDAITRLGDAERACPVVPKLPLYLVGDFLGQIRPRYGRTMPPPPAQV
jgi:hypothetical protein